MGKFIILSILFVAVTMFILAMAKPEGKDNANKGMKPAKAMGISLWVCLLYFALSEPIGMAVVLPVLVLSIAILAIIGLKDFN